MEQLSGGFAQVEHYHYATPPCTSLGLRRSSDLAKLKARAPSRTRPSRCASTRGRGTTTSGTVYLRRVADGRHVPGPLRDRARLRRDGAGADWIVAVALAVNVFGGVDVPGTSSMAKNGVAASPYDSPFSRPVNSILFPKARAAASRSAWRAWSANPFVPTPTSALPEVAHALGLVQAGACACPRAAARASAAREGPAAPPARTAVAFPRGGSPPNQGGPRGISARVSTATCARAGRRRSSGRSPGACLGSQRKQRRARSVIA